MNIVNRYVFLRALENFCRVLAEKCANRWSKIDVPPIVNTETADAEPNRSHEIVHCHCHTKRNAK